MQKNEITSVASLEIQHYVPENEEENFDKIMREYDLHPCITKLKENTLRQKLEQDIRNLDARKACVGNDIPTKLLVENNDIVRDHLCKNIQ